MEARIVAVADAIEAITSDRPYRNARNTDEIIQELQRCSGTQLDRDVVNAFVCVVHSEGLAIVLNSAISKRDLVREPNHKLGTLTHLRTKS